MNEEKEQWKKSKDCENNTKKSYGDNDGGYEDDKKCHIPPHENTWQRMNPCQNLLAHRRREQRMKLQG